MTIRKMMVNVLLGLTPLSLSACTSLFFQPDAIDYISATNRQLEFRDLSIPTGDGQLLHGMELSPPGSPKGLVLHFNGNAQNMTSHISYIAWLKDHDYKMISFDYRGYGLSIGTPSQTGLHQDALAVLEFVASQPDYANLDLFIVAQSQG